MRSVTTFRAIERRHGIADQVVPRRPPSRGLTRARTGVIWTARVVERATATRRGGGNNARRLGPSFGARAATATSDDNGPIFHAASLIALRARSRLSSALSESRRRHPVRYLPGPSSPLRRVSGAGRRLAGRSVALVDRPI